MSYGYGRRRYGQSSNGSRGQNRYGNAGRSRSTKPKRTRISNSGYKQFYDEREGRWVYVHRRVAEKKLRGQIYDGYEVHHRNRDKSDNRPENLVVLSKRDHRRVHDLEEEIEGKLERAEYASSRARRQIYREVRDLEREHDWIESKDRRRRWR